MLVDMEGYPVQEAARILEVPPGTIKSRCARGRARLAVLLADLDTDAGEESEHGTIGGPAASHSGDPPPGARPTADPPRPDRPAGPTPETDPISMPTRARR